MKPVSVMMYVLPAKPLTTPYANYEADIVGFIGGDSEITLVKDRFGYGYDHPGRTLTPDAFVRYLAEVARPVR